MTFIAPQRISAVAEECVNEAAELVRLLHRLSDAELAPETADCLPELVTAVRATRNSLTAIREFVRHEVGRLGL